MSTTPTYQPIPPQFENLREPTRADAIEVMGRRAGNGVPKDTSFANTSVGRRCAEGGYGSGDFCRDAKAKHDATREREIAATLERLTREYETKQQRRQKIEAHNAEVAAAEKAMLRDRYLAAGGTDAEFEAAYPQLLEEHRRQQMANSQALEQQRAAQMRASFGI